jgi:hypothetical protein
MRAGKPAKIAAGVVDEPLRILVGGSSCSVLVSPPRTRRDEGTYGELLPRQLRPHGVVAETIHEGHWFGMVNEFRPRYENHLRNHFPDVLIINYGFAECEPNFLPYWLARHFSTWDLSSAAIPTLYRRRIKPRLWRIARSYQRQASRLTSNHSFRVSPRRFVADLRRIITMARSETGCLVLLLDIDPPGERLQYWMPGMWQRWERYQGLLEKLVADLDDPQVRLIPNSRSILDELGFEVGEPDGIHRSAVGHARTAEVLTAEILDWLNS